MTVRSILIRIRHFYLTKLLGMDIHPTAIISLKAKLDKTNPKGIHIGEGSYVTAGVRILTHDYCRKIHTDTYIGAHCFIGTDSLILCGVRVGDESIVGGGSVVTKDTPPQFDSGWQPCESNQARHTHVHAWTNPE